MRHEQFEHQNAANTRENERFELQTVAKYSWNGSFQLQNARKRTGQEIKKNKTEKTNNFQNNSGPIHMCI